MNKLLMVGVLLLATAAGACPVKKGFWFNGLITQRAGLMEPICGAVYDALRTSVKPEPGQWVEAYLLEKSRTSVVTLATLGKAITEKGYKQTVNRKKGNDLLWGFAKGDKQIILSIHDGEAVVGLTVLGN